jgi:hypothetical protein
MRSKCTKIRGIGNPRKKICITRHEWAEEEEIEEQTKRLKKLLIPTNSIDEFIATIDVSDETYIQRIQCVIADGIMLV